MQHRVAATRQEQLYVEPYWELDASVSCGSHARTLDQTYSTNNVLFRDKYRRRVHGAGLLHCEEKAEI